MMSIVHNMVMMNAERQFGVITGKKSKSTEKLSSGYKINRAADDAAGLSISEKMRRQIRGLNKAVENIQDGISLCQVADGALNEVHDILQQMHELAVKAGNDTNSQADRSFIQTEIDSLAEEIDRIANQTTFNEHIYPLLESSITSKFASVSEIDSLDVCGYVKSFDVKVSQSNLNNLYPYLYDIPNHPDKYIDVYYQLNSANNELEMYAADGTLLFHGEVKCQWGADVSLSNWFFNDDVPTRFPRGDFTLYVNAGAPTEYFTAVQMEYNFGLERGMSVSNINKSLRNDFVVFSLNPDRNNWIPVSKKIGNTVAPVNATAGDLGVDCLDVSSIINAGQAIDCIKTALEQVSWYRTGFGSLQNRLEHAMLINENIVENTTAAESRIRDADIATEMVSFSNLSILQQAGQAVLAHAQQDRQYILSLLQ